MFSLCFTMLFSKGFIPSSWLNDKPAYVKLDKVAKLLIELPAALFCQDCEDFMLFY